MVDTITMSHILARLMEVHDCKCIDELLSKVLIVLVGDMAQVRALLDRRIWFLLVNRKVRPRGTLGL